jgi:glucosylglycerate phosphorylase
MGKKSISEKLKQLYGEGEGEETADKIIKIVNKVNRVNQGEESKSGWSEKDIVLITYPDAFYESEVPTLVTLNKFLNEFVKDSFSTVHILPFYPYTADRGFSVADYREVKKEFGTWNEIENIGQKYQLMTDLVGNHVSREHKWFRKFLAGDKKYENYFIWFDEAHLPPAEQIKMVRRGRTTPLLTPFETAKGKRYLWTTYSIGELIDQIDLNYKNPEVLLEMIKVFLFYLSKGVNVIRLDGVGGMWKELGTTSKHLPRNKLLVSVFRDILEELKSQTRIFTETTTATPEENISYAGETMAHGVYNFSLAPLILQAFYTGRADELTKFAEKLVAPEGSEFFNILDVHDGINVYAASHILSPETLQGICDEVESRGGTFSYRSLPSGEKAVKEMNITWWSAINKDGENPFEIELQRFLTSRAIALSLKGLPGIYYLSLFGGKNDETAFKSTRHGRDMNRTNFNYGEIAAKLGDKNSREAKIFREVTELLRKRKEIPAFNPDSSQEILDLDPRIFALLRGEEVLALHNVSADSVEVKYHEKFFKLAPFSFLWEKIK